MNLAKQTVVVVAVLLGLALPVAARTWRVEKDGSGDFTVIQDAVDAAAAGDTIRIGPGRSRVRDGHGMSMRMCPGTD